MTKINNIIKIVALVAKYGAIAVAVVKGIEVMVEELKKIKLDD
jgi:hypothetical protein